MLDFWQEGRGKQLRDIQPIAEVVRQHQEELVGTQEDAHKTTISSIIRGKTVPQEMRSNKSRNLKSTHTTIQICKLRTFLHQQAIAVPKFLLNYVDNVKNNVREVIPIRLWQGKSMISRSDATMEVESKSNHQ
jgi:hypothetical protein